MPHCKSSKILRKNPQTSNFKKSTKIWCGPGRGAGEASVEVHLPGPRHRQSWPHTRGKGLTGYLAFSFQTAGEKMKNKDLAMKIKREKENVERPNKFYSIS